MDTGHREKLVDSVRPPSPSAGGAQEIMAEPRGMFVVAASRAKPCESRLYRFRLTSDGHATGITPIKGSITPGLAAGLAISPDARRIAYATTPCADGPSTQLHSTSPQAASPPSVGLAVLDVTTGHRRTRTTGAHAILGEIVWADDNHTLGYTISDVIPRTPTPLPPEASSIAELSGDTISNVTTHALDTDAPGSDLPAGRVLFRPPDDSGTVRSVVMNPDGRTGFGMMKKGRPPSTLLFSFAEGEPMRVTRTIPPDPKDTIVLFSLGDDPRYACLNGLDAFGRVREGTFMSTWQGFRGCGTAMAY